MTTNPASRFTPLAIQLAQILGGLRTAIATCGGRRMLGWDRRPDDPRIVPLIIPICARIARLLARFERLIARLAAGWRPTPASAGWRPTPAPAHPLASPRTNPATPALPRGFGWLLQLTHGATGASGHLQALLAEPGMADLLALAPSAGRILRPLARMLGIQPAPPLAETAPPPPTPAGPRPPRHPNGRYCAAPPPWQAPLSRFSTPR